VVFFVTILIPEDPALGPFQLEGGMETFTEGTVKEIILDTPRTLAEFAFANSRTGGQWNWDWFDISVIPPGCPGTISSYEGCWCNGGSDGYDVGMRITPVKCRNKQRTCLNRKCPDAYGFPKDDTKTTVCQDISGDFEVEFCPAGSHIDLGTTQLSQTPPCKGGPANFIPPKSGSPPPAARSPPPPAPRPAASGSCVMDKDIDYYGNDISNKPVRSKEECCSFCSSLNGCGAWTYAAGVCYAKRAAGSTRKAAAGLWSGTVRSRAVAADSQTFSTNNESQAQSPTSTAILAVLIVVAVVIVIFFIAGFVINVKILSGHKISERV